MKVRRAHLIRAIITLGFTLVIFLFLNQPIADVIPFSAGRFFSPFTGFWKNGDETIALQETLQLEGLEEPVIIHWDDRKVPHIFAQTDHDLFMVQGYLTARDRLWQMEFLSYVAAGRLSEILGDRPGIIDHDRLRRRVGMVYAAEIAIKDIMQHPPSRPAIESYNRGVNAWIESLVPANLPLEYKILDYIPEMWTPLKSALIMKYMAWDLTGRNEELQFSRLRSLKGNNQTAQLFINDYYSLESIIPASIRWTFTPVDRPVGPDTLFSPVAEQLFDSLGQQPSPHNGSNNWVVSGQKTASGKPILCNDPHLRLTLPSIWYENQLISPNVNVYGVSLPGMPTVIIGFNDHIAWGVTNASTDVMDWYDVRLRDSRAREYWHEGAWHPTRKRVEAIKVRNTRSLFDTVTYTHHGPVAYMPGEKSIGDEYPSGAALRWTAHDPANELRASLLINRARNIDEFQEALRFYECPAQNFIFAGDNGDIAIQHTGKFPLRWPYQGRYISDGTSVIYDWQGYIPYEQLPAARNPREAFLSSANQPPVGKTYPYLMYGKYATFERAARINERLREMEDITPQGMMRLQLDNLNLKARSILPVLLDVLDTTLQSDTERLAGKELRTWQYDNQSNLIAPMIFESWWDSLEYAIWSDDLPRIENNDNFFPDAGQTVRLIVADTASIYFDNQNTPDRERFKDIVRMSYHAAVTSLIERQGAFGNLWQWGTARGTDINHLARLPGLGRMDLFTSGNNAIVNATRKHHGPSWRMIVALGDQRPQAWGIYPGGQSGNPGSRYYDQFVNPWVDGQYYELLYLTSPMEISARLVGKTLLQNRLTP